MSDDLARSRAGATAAPMADVFAGPGRPRVLLISHSYLEVEHLKTFLALRAHVDARLLVPRRLPTPSHLRGRFFKTLTADAIASHCPEPILMPRRAIYGPGSPHLYVLASLSMGMRRCRPDIVHVDLPPWSPVFWQAVLARRLFAPSAQLVVSAKKNTYRPHSGAFAHVKWIVGNAGLRKVTCVAAASQKAEDLYVREFGLPPSRVRVMPQLGVDGRLFRPKGDSVRSRPCVVGFVGRMEVEKGVLDLVEAVDRCTAAGLDVRLHLAGSGTLDARLEALAASRPWLVLCGALPGQEIARFLRTLDVFVLAAQVMVDHEEHDAHALREALASGLATIGTRSGVIPDLLSDGTGLLVHPADPVALSQALDLVVRDLNMRNLLSRKGREKAERELLCESVAAACAQMYIELAQVAPCDAAGARR